MPADSRVRTHRFRTTADLQGLLASHQPNTDVLVMAAAVADYRPKADPQALSGKTRRTSAGLTLQLESTPDLLAECASRRSSGQLMVGFALEPRDELLASARGKLQRKKIDLIVGNPLETMDSPRIEAIVIGREGSGLEEGTRTSGPIDKADFASWLIGVIDSARARLTQDRP